MIPNIENKVVVHFRDARIVKGYTYDFNPNKETFHVANVQNGREIIEVTTSQVKAVFFR
ncbi:MAG: hypothetical protein GTN74_06060 [Proteobacteria bacterium]|nr:hypothetical protein [Pseudomonadota bacterium]NIS69113.1 hypothetical protein [Pseudomonadota bacterium]